MNNKWIRIGIVSDTHLASDGERLDRLHEFYDWLESEEIERVYHAGDISDGTNVYRGQEFHLKQIGTDKQAKYVIENFPQRKKIRTFFITGNHDLRAFERTRVDIGSLISRGVEITEEETKPHKIEGRKDLKYLGQYYGRVKLNESIKLDLVHPDGGFSYAISYPLQRYVNEIQGGNKPHILVMGHFHRTMYTVYRNIHCFMGGTFQDQNDYTRRRGIQPNLGGWLLEMEIDHGIKQMKPIWRAFYR